MAPLDNENENPQTHITNEPPADGSLPSEAPESHSEPADGEMPSRPAPNPEASASSDASQNVYHQVSPSWQGSSQQQNGPWQQQSGPYGQNSYGSYQQGPAGPGNSNTNYYGQDQWNSRNAQYQRPPYRRRTNSFAVAALILGILSLVTSCCIFSGIVFGAFGVVLALLSRGQEPMDTQAKIGLGLSIAGMVLGFLVLLGSFIFLSSSVHQELENFYYNRVPNDEYNYYHDYFDPYGYDHGSGDLDDYFDQFRYYYDN